MHKAQELISCMMRPVILSYTVIVITGFYGALIGRASTAIVVRSSKSRFAIDVRYMQLCHEVVGSGLWSRR